MRARSLCAVLGALAMSALAPACSAAPDDEVLPPVVLGMLDSIPPIYDDGQSRVFQVGTEVRLPFRRAREGERPRGEADPYPRVPFHLARDARITIRFTLSNLDDRQHTVELLVDPWNEFVRYVPGVSVIREDEVLPNFSGIQRPFVLPPKARVEGIITPDDIVELATDLTVAMALERRPPDAAGPFGGAALYNRTFNIQNRSSEPDPVLAPWLPADRSAVAGLVGFDVGLRTAEPAKVAVELVIDVIDLLGERLVREPEDRRLGRPGTVLSPPSSGPAAM